MLDVFLDERRSGLQRWLILISQNPVLSKDEMFKLFLTRSSNEFPDVSYTGDEFELRPPSMQLDKFNNAEDIIVKRESVRKIMNQLLTVKRLMMQQTKRRIMQRKDYGDLATTLSTISKASADILHPNLKDFSENFTQIAKSTETDADDGVIERLELLHEVLTAFSDLCERVIYQKQMSLCDDKTNKGFNGLRLRNMIRSNLSSYDDELDRIELQKKRVSFGIYCVHSEYKLVQNYLLLLPSILLQFTYNESKTYSDVSHTLRDIIDKESDKLSS
jgi:hypothetical protein